MKTLNLFFFFVTAAMFSQQFEIKGKIETTAILSNKSVNPFWFHTNTHYSIGEFTNLSATAEANATWAFSSFNINTGGSMYGRDGVDHAVQRKELYVQFENSWLFATIGSKARKIVADGLSATNKNFLWSGNARPLPGIILEANNPIKISNTFGIDWGIAHYQLNDNRYVKNVHLHYKRLALVTTFNENNKLTAQVQHFAQWGGTSPVYGQLKDGFGDFVNVFFASDRAEITGSEDETINKVGNHLGSYLLDYEFKNSFGKFSVYHEHPFDDGSGTRLANFPDGVWGAYFMPKNLNIISAILYEYIDTVDQSGISIASGKDNYFSNSIYRSGWTYEENIIGLPFIIYNKNLPLSTIESRFISTRSKTHHLGIAGKFEMLKWQLKTTYIKYLGTYGKPLSPNWKYWYNYVSLTYNTQKLGTFTVMGGVDFSNVANTLVGGGVQYAYSF